MIIRMLENKEAKRKAKIDRKARARRIEVYRERENELMEKARRLENFKRINEIRRKCIEI